MPTSPDPRNALAFRCRRGAEKSTPGGQQASTARKSPTTPSPSPRAARPPPSATVTVTTKGETARVTATAPPTAQIITPFGPVSSTAKDRLHLYLTTGLSHLRCSSP